MLLFRLCSFFDKTCSFLQNTTKYRSILIFVDTQSHFFKYRVFLEQFSKMILSSGCVLKFIFLIEYISFTQYCLYLVNVRNNQIPIFSIHDYFCVLQIFIFFILGQLTLYFIMLKNGQTYFKNLAV